jgi:hypothetical protein
MTTTQLHRHASRRTPRHWVDDLDAGYIVLFRSGVIRAVLDAFKRPDGRLVCVAMPILHCSWTRAGITFVDRWQFRTTARLHVGWLDIRRQPLMRELLKNMHLGRRDRTLTCCDVVGVVE